MEPMLMAVVGKNQEIRLGRKHHVVTRPENLQEVIVPNCEIGPEVAKADSDLWFHAQDLILETNAGQTPQKLNLRRSIPSPFLDELPVNDARRGVPA
jgi:hypothetical protein